MARKKSRERLWWAAALLLALGLAGAAMYWRPSQTIVNYRFEVPMNGDGFFGGKLVAISPDGKALLFAATPKGSRRAELYVRRLDSFEVRRIEGSVEAAFGTFSPDGKSIVFAAMDHLKRCSTAGGPTEVITAIPPISGISVGKDAIVLGQEEGPILRVTPTPLKVEPITRIDAPAFEVGHVHPSFLPDGKRFLFTTVTRNPARPGMHRLYGASVSGGDAAFIGEITSAVEYSSGQLIYSREGAAMAVPFDEKNLEITGQPATIADDVYFFQPRGSRRISAAADGTIAWQGTVIGDRVELLDPKGARIRTIREGIDISGWISASPDGRTVAVSVEDPRIGTYDLWQYGLERDTARRLTSSPAWESYPVFSPDGTRLYFATDRHGIPDIYSMSLDGSGEQALVKASREQIPLHVSPDGRLLLYRDNNRGNQDLMLLPLGGGPARPFMASDASESLGAFSPDGTHIAFQSNDSGRMEIYIKPVAGGMPQQLTTSGAVLPNWSADGNALYFMDVLRKTVLVSRRTGAAWTDPEVVFARERSVLGGARLPNGNFIIADFDETATDPVKIAVRWSPSR